MKFLLRALLAIVSITSLSAVADGYLKLGAMYMMGAEGSDEMNETSRTLLDLGAGYVWPKGWTLGALYGIEKRKYGEGTTDLERTSYGPTVGWITRDSDGPYILGSYFLKSERNDYEGTGYQVDLGYKFDLSKVALAMQVSYKGFEYTKSNGNSINPPYKEKYLDPYFVLMIEF